MVIEILMSAAAVVAAPQERHSGSAIAQLAVGATVIRPVEVSAAASANGALVTLKNAGGADVQVIGGTMEAADKDTLAVKADGSQRLVVTISY